MCNFYAKTSHKELLASVSIKPFMFDHAALQEQNFWGAYQITLVEGSLIKTLSLSVDVYDSMILYSLRN